MEGVAGRCLRFPQVQALRRGGGLASAVPRAGARSACREGTCACVRAGVAGDIVNVSFSKCRLTECLVQQSVSVSVCVCVACVRAEWLPGISTLGGSSEGWLYTNTIFPP